jgi:hypothetical protein
VEPDAVICGSCDFILDASFLGDDITDDEKSVRPGRGGLRMGDDFGDALILGDGSGEMGTFQAGDSGLVQKEATHARFYVSGASQALLAPDAIPALKEGVDPSTLRLTPFERHLLTFVDGQSPVDRLRRKSGMEDLDVKTTLATLADKGVIYMAGRAFADDGAKRPKQPATRTVRDETSVPKPLPGKGARKREPSVVAAAPVKEPTGVKARKREPSVVAAAPAPGKPREKSGQQAPVVAPAQPERTSIHFDPSLVAKSQERTMAVTLEDLEKARAVMRGEKEATPPPPPPKLSRRKEKSVVAQASSLAATAPMEEAAAEARARASEEERPPLEEPAATSSEADAAGFADPGQATAERMAPRELLAATRPAPPPPPLPPEALEEEEAAAPEPALDGEAEVPSLLRPAVTTAAEAVAPADDDAVPPPGDAEAAAPVEPPPADDVDVPPPESEDGGEQVPAPSPVKMDPVLAASMAAAGDAPPAFLREPSMVEDLPLDAMVPMPGQPPPPPPPPLPTLNMAGPTGLLVMDAKSNVKAVISATPPAAPEAPAARKAAPAPRAVEGEGGGEISHEQRYKAQKIFEQALKDVAAKNMSSARMNAKLATIYDPHEARYQNALRDWDKLGNAAPGAAPGRAREVELFEKAQEAEMRGDFKEAVKLLEQAIQAKPDAAGLYNRLGVVLATRLKEFDRAFTVLEKAIELDPDNPSFKNNLGKVLAWQEAASERDKKKKGGFFSKREKDKDADQVVIRAKKFRPKEF